MYTNSTILTLLFSISVTCNSFLHAQDNDRTIRVGALIRSLDEIQIPAKRPGVIESLNFRKGDELSAGDVLAKIETADAQAELAVARAEHAAAKHLADDNSGIELATSELDVAQAEHSTLNRVRRSVVELERVRAGGELSGKKSNLAYAKSQKLYAELSSTAEKARLDVAERNVLQRTVTSPFDASVSKVYHFKGEWVKEGDPIASVIRMDKLQAEGFVSVRDVSPYRISGAKVRFTLEDGRTSFDGTVKNASPKVESDGKYQIWFVIENRKSSDLNGVAKWVLRPGMAGQMEVVIPSEQNSENTESRGD